MNAYNHFTQNKGMTDYAKSKGVPAPAAAVFVAGVLLLLGGLGILFGAYIRWAVFALVLFFLPVTFMMHAYWKDTDPGQKMGNRVNFYKNLALLGASLLLLSIPEPWVYSVQ